jgi:hypothetical protein
VREWGTGLTRIEQFIAELKPARIVPGHKLDDGINAAREIFGICQFDEAACSEGLKALRNYRKEWDEENGCWKDRPLHNWASHGADGYRYLAMVYRDAPPQQEAAPPPKGITDMTFDELLSSERAPSTRV